MKAFAIGLIALVCLVGCVDIAGENEGTFTFDGETYRAVEREFVTENRSYSKRYIYSRPHPVSCSLTDDRDCELAILISRTRAANR